MVVPFHAYSVIEGVFADRPCSTQKIRNPFFALWQARREWSGFSVQQNNNPCVSRVGIDEETHFKVPGM